MFQIKYAFGSSAHDPIMDIGTPSDKIMSLLIAGENCILDSEVIGKVSN